MGLEPLREPEIEIVKEEEVKAPVVVQEPPKYYVQFNIQQQKNFSECIIMN